MVTFWCTVTLLHFLFDRLFLRSNAARTRWEVTFVDGHKMLTMPKGRADLVGSHKPEKVTAFHPLMVQSNPHDTPFKPVWALQATFQALPETMHGVPTTSGPIGPVSVT